MESNRPILNYITLVLKSQVLQRWGRRSGAVFALVLSVAFSLVGQVVMNEAVYAVNTDNFYFSDFTADYYLSKDAEGVSHLRVVEQLTAEFPDFNQNKGIRREIPFANQGGINTVLPNLTRNDIKVLRNGEPEPIWDINRNGDYYAVETGTDDYVLGTQVYTLEYEFEKVVTDFGSHQELYWDTNGTGWMQRFDKVTARVHFDDDVEAAFTGESSCYVGSYGESGMDRCTSFEISDGMEFTAQNLAPYENLTFEVEFKPGTFTVPEPENDYTMVIALVIVTVGCGAFLGYRLMKYQKIAQKIKEYKGIFVAPQYQPHSDYSLAEMAEIYLGKKKDVKVGILLDLIVKKKVELHKKGDEGINIKHRWALVVKDTDIREEGMVVLEILANKLIIKPGDVIELESRTATTMLRELGKQFDRVVSDDLKEAGLVTGKYKIGNTGSLNAVSGLFSSVMATFMTAFIIVMLIAGLTDGVALDTGIVVRKNMVFGVPAVIIMAVMVFTTITVAFWTGKRTRVIGEVTTKGMEASKYMEGLKLYIKMAETDRMKMLQSVKGVDTTPEGIVKLYEKLLPYAAVFGLEESWMNEMKEFCNAKEVVEPDYLMTGIAVSQLSRTMRSAAGYASSSGHTIAGGGSYSSSSSGGGGGGFSGGGGGGGGGGGR